METRYKIGDVLIEDRRGYPHRGPYKERDAKYPICILRVDNITDRVEYNGVTVHEGDPVYYMYNATIDTYTIGEINTIDSLKSVRLAKETEIYIYGGGRERLEKTE